MVGLLSVGADFPIMFLDSSEEFIESSVDLDIYGCLYFVIFHKYLFRRGDS